MSMEKSQTSVFEERGVIDREEYVLPAGWEEWKVAHGFRKIGSGTTPKSDNPEYYNGDIPWVTTAELREKYIDDTSVKVTDLALEECSALKIYKPGALLIAMYGATIGRLGILNIDATVNQACCVFEDPVAFDTKYVYYWLWMRRPDLIALSVGGGQPNLSQDDLKQLRIPVPSIHEQRKIASFLDKKTKQIDDLIAKKEQLLKLLAEKRTALITQTVTKGLDPTVKMKDSGLEWLGAVPAHWEVKRLKYLLSEPLKYGANEPAENTDADQPRYIRITDFGADGKLRDDTFKSLDLEKALPYMLNDGDILLARSGATVGKAFLYRKTEGVAAYAGYLIRARVTKELSSDYLIHFLWSDVYWSWIRSIFIQATIQNVSAEKYANLWVPYPPSSEEQSRVIQYISQRLVSLEYISKKTLLSIDKLKEYRAALITTAVTGKLNLTNYDQTS